MEGDFGKVLWGVHCARVGLARGGALVEVDLAAGAVAYELT